MTKELDDSGKYSSSIKRTQYKKQKELDAVGSTARRLQAYSMRIEDKYREKKFFLATNLLNEYIMQAGQ